MRLWLLKRVGSTGHDEAAGFVVRAMTKAYARELVRWHAGDEGGDVWLHPSTATCEEISLYDNAGIILKDFRAG